MAKKVKKEAEKKVEVKEEEVKEVQYVCTELCFHDGRMYKKGDILKGNPPKGKNGEVRHFEEVK